VFRCLGTRLLLKYQNKRKDYIEAFFNIINWKKVNEKFNAAAIVE